MIKRQNTTTKKGLLLTTSDIIEAIQKLGDSGSMPIFAFAVEFSSLGKLPLAKPYEKCPISLCERKAKLEARVGECESAMTETNCAIASMQSKISYASIAMQPAGPAPPGQQRVTPRQRQVLMESTSQNGLATGSNSEPRDPSAAVRPKSHSNVMQPPRGGGFHPQARTSSVWSLESAASKSDAPTEGFEFDAREKRRRMRRRRSAITGKKKAEECRLKAPAPKRTRDIFVYQWHRIWDANGKPGNGVVYDLMLKAKREYKSAVRWVLRHQDELSSMRMADGILNNKSRDLVSFSLRRKRQDHGSTKHTAHEGKGTLKLFAKEAPTPVNHHHVCHKSTLPEIRLGVIEHAGFHNLIDKFIRVFTLLATMNSCTHRLALL
ncbi:hypothetical protein CAPTEDRAFT_207315 [Capitella teleta]|uniref:Uncharacterized protein n=1 Tax=Capitella teleta TaxID=283909 RepID=R7T3Y6_CAPTE|nr:hypothetical protein CAPTEDRAFT_207315 [Capitella teleta]|eukprot:ELT87503.1 hypothetical protein CAPTEDRAFT_207315 [Capitella teleta]